MPCQTNLAQPDYRIHQEESNIGSVNNPSPSPTFLLSGASGFLGSAIRQALVARDSSVLQLVRSTPSAPNQLRWNPRSTPAIPNPETLEGLTAAIHLSGANLAAHRWTANYKREIAESRILSTRALATTLASLRNPPHTLLVASATGIYGNRGDELIDETSPVGSGYLADLCRHWEAAAQPALDAGIRVLYLRFGVVLSNDPGSALTKLLPIFRLGLGGQLANGRQYMSWIALPDAVASILFLIDSPNLKGPINITSPNPVTNAQFTGILSTHLHRPALLTIPRFAIRLALGEMADETVLSSARAYPARLAAGGFQFQHAALIHALPALLL